MSRNAAIVSGIILIQLVTVMWGGVFLLLALWAQLAIDRVRLATVLEWLLRFAFPVAALLMSVGFFMSAGAAAAGGSDPSMVLRIGAVLLGASLLSLAGLLLLRRQT